MKSKRPRFTRAMVLDLIRHRVDALEKERGFDDSGGWAQVDGKGEEVNRAYGEFSALNDLLEEIEP